METSQEYQAQDVGEVVRRSDKPEYFYTSDRGSYLFALHFHVDEPGYDLHNGWRCDVGPGDIAYTYWTEYPATCKPAEYSYLRREEIPFERRPRGKR